MPKRKIYDSWKDGSDVFKDKKGYYIVEYKPRKKVNSKKYLPKKCVPSTTMKKKTPTTMKKKTPTTMKKKTSGKKCNIEKVLNPISNRCVKNCPKGYIIRNSYIRNLKGNKTVVPAKCIKSIGLPGKTSNKYLGKNKGIGKLNKGELSKHGYSNIKSLTKTKRHKYLNSAIKEYGSSKILKKLGAIKTYQKNKNPEVSRVLYDNMKWVRKKYDKDFKSSWKDSNLYK